MTNDAATKENITMLKRLAVRDIEYIRAIMTAATFDFN